MRGSRAAAREPRVRPIAICDSGFVIGFAIYESRFTNMQLARVIGTVVATIKNESLEGRKLLVVQTLNKDLEPSGKPMVAVDSVGAGVGELVFWCRGKEASFPFKREDTPTDCTIIAIVDSNAHVTQG